MCVCVCVFGPVQFFTTPWTVAHQTPLSMEFSRQEYCSVLPFPPLGDLPNSGMEPCVSCIGRWILYPCTTWIYLNCLPCLLFLSFMPSQDFPVTQTVKNLPAMQETRVRFLGWEVPLEKGMAIHSSVLAWRILWTEKPGGI